MLLSHSNLDGGDGACLVATHNMQLLCFEIVSKPLETGDIAPHRSRRAGQTPVVQSLTALRFFRANTFTHFPRHLAGLTFAQRELPVFELISPLQGDTAYVSDVFAVCHRHGREVIHELTRSIWRGKLCGKSVLHAFQNVVQYDRREPVSQGTASQDASGRPHVLPHHVSCTGDTLAEVRLQGCVQRPLWKIPLQCKSDDGVRRHTLSKNFSKSKNKQTDGCPLSVATSSKIRLSKPHRSAVFPFTASSHQPWQASSQSRASFLVAVREDCLKAPSERDKPFANSIWLALQGHNVDADLGGERERLFTTCMTFTMPAIAPYGKRNISAMNASGTGSFHA